MNLAELENWGSPSLSGFRAIVPKETTGWFSGVVLAK
jgi:hypothetical protein